MVQTMSPHQSPGWLRIVGSSRAPALRLFCLPHAGGTAAAFAPWARYLPSSIEVTAIQLPGHGDRLSEAPMATLQPLAEAIASAVEARLDRPFALFGHSMGALLAFEVARTLRRRHRTEPAHLIVSGCRAPTVPDRGSVRHDLPDAEMLAEVEQFNGAPPELLANPDFTAVLLPALRADFEALDKYVYVADAPLACAITVLGGLADDRVRREHLEPWRDETTGVTRVALFPGGHFFINEARDRVLGTLLLALQEPRNGAPCTAAGVALSPTRRLE